MKDMEDFFNFLKKGERLYFKERDALNPMFCKIERAIKEDCSGYLYLDLNSLIFLEYNYTSNKHKKISIERVEEVIRACIEEQQKVFSFLENRHFISNDKINLID